MVVIFLVCLVVLSVNSSSAMVSCGSFYVGVTGERSCGVTRSYGGQDQVVSPVFTLISWLRVSTRTNGADMNLAAGCTQPQEFRPFLGERDSF